MADIASVFTAVKTATEIANYVYKASDTLDKAETKLQLANLISALADAKMQTAEIKELLLEKDAIISELNATIEQKTQMKWRGTAYFMETSNGEEGPFCPQCYDNNQKAIRLQVFKNERWECPTCNRTFYGEDYKPTPIKRRPHNPHY